MESSENPLEKPNRIKKKLVPWHYQKRYQTSFSQHSFNQTFNKALYDRKIKSLLNNNRNLARALECSRNELLDKENIQKSNIRKEDILKQSSRALRELLQTLKKVTICLEETVEQLDSHIETNQPRNLNCQNVRINFQKRIREVAKISNKLGTTLEELEPTLESNSDPVSSIEPTIKDMAKTIAPMANKNKVKVKKPKKQGLKAQNTISHQKITVRTSKPLADDTPPSYLLGISSDNESYLNLIEQTKKASKRNSTQGNSMPKRNLKRGLKPRMSAMLNSRIEQKHLDNESMFVQSSKKNKKVNGGTTQSNNDKSSPHKKVKVVQFGSEKPQNSSKDSLSSIDEKSVEKSLSPSLETNFKALKIANATNCQPIAYIPEPPGNIVQNDLKANTELGNLRDVLDRNDIMQEDTGVEKLTMPLNEIVDESNKLSQTSLQLRSSVKTTSSCQKEIIDESNTTSKTLRLRSSVKRTSSCQKKVGFHLKEDKEIQFLGETKQPVAKPKLKYSLILGETKQPVAKPKLKNSLKRPLRESTQNIQRKKHARPNSAFEAMDPKEQCTFTITAEVHQPMEGYTPVKRLTVDDIHSLNLNMQPRVVLTDIVSSNSIILEKVNFPVLPVKENLPTLIVENEYTEDLMFESSPCDCEIQHNCNKENKMDDENESEARKDDENESEARKDDENESEARKDDENESEARKDDQNDSEARKEIDDQNDSEARRQSRRRSKVHSYKEMNLNVKIRRF